MVRRPGRVIVTEMVSDPHTFCWFAGLYLTPCLNFGGNASTYDEPQATEETSLASAVAPFLLCAAVTLAITPASLFLLMPRILPDSDLCVLLLLARNAACEGTPRL